MQGKQSRLFVGTAELSPCLRGIAPAPADLQRIGSMKKIETGAVERMSTQQPRCKLPPDPRIGFLPRPVIDGSHDANHFLPLIRKPCSLRACDTEGRLMLQIRTGKRARLPQRRFRIGVAPP